MRLSSQQPPPLRGFLPPPDFHGGRDIPLQLVRSASLLDRVERIGNSVVNIITPLNSYLLIILVVLQKYKKDAGLGSLISLMLPYSLIFGVVWTAFLVAWYYSGFPLGTDAPLHYVPKM